MSSGDGQGGRDRTGPTRQSPLSQIRRAQGQAAPPAPPPEPEERAERTIVAPLGGAGGGVRRAQGSPARAEPPPSAPPRPAPDELRDGDPADGEATEIAPRETPLRRTAAASLSPDFEPSFELPPMAVRNPLVWLATRILVRLAGVRSGRLAASAPVVHAEMEEAIGRYRDALGDVGYDAATRDSALYAVAATVDDVMQNIPAAQGFQWAQRSMVIRFFGENIGGDRFWSTVDDLLRRPSGREELIELYHACVAAGFLGRFRLANLSARDDPGVAGRMAAMSAELARVVARTGDPLSPRWRGVVAPTRRVGLTAPILLALGLAACLALAGFAYFFFTLGERTDATAAAMQNLHPRLQLVLIERNTPPAPPPPPAAEPTNTGSSASVRTSRRRSRPARSTSRCGAGASGS